MAGDAIRKGEGLFGEQPIGAMVGNHALAQIGEDPCGQDEQRETTRPIWMVDRASSGPVLSEVSVKRGLGS